MFMSNCPWELCVEHQPCFLLMRRVKWLNKYSPVYNFWTFVTQMWFKLSDGEPILENSVWRVHMIWLSLFGKYSYRDSSSNMQKFSFFFFGFQHLLRKASLAEDDAFAFLKGDNQGDFITFSALHEALCQVLYFINFAMWDVNFSYKINSLWSNVIQFKLIGHPYGLSSQEMKKLWAQADINGDGVIDYEEFKVSSSPKLLNMT